MTQKETSFVISQEQVQQQNAAISCNDRQPPNNQITNTMSPNRRQLSSSPPPRISTSSSILSDSDSPCSYTSYSSAEYSSLGGGRGRQHNNGENQTDNMNCVGSNTSKKRVLLKSIHTNSNSNTNFDNEFSHGLLSQVHKMQSLLEEYQHSLTALELEKADKQQEINSLDKRLKTKSETEERYKEEIWNLELKNQDLYQKFDELKQCYAKSKSENTQISRASVILNQEIEQLKAMKQSWEQKLQEAQIDHEREIINIKKSLHTSKLEKEDLSKQIQDLIAQHAAAMATTNLRRVTEEDDFIGEHKIDRTTPSNSLAVKRNSIETKSNKSTTNTTTEIVSLKKSLDHAHEIIQTMQEKLDKEREERIEVDKLLREAQETIENFNLISHNNSTQWYPIVQSPTQHSLHSNDDHVNSRSFLSPTSSLSIHSSHSNDSSHHQYNYPNLSRQPSRKSTVGLCSGKSCRKRFASASKSPYLVRGGGKSLCDELSQAGSIGNFASSTTELINSPLKSRISESDEELGVITKIHNEPSSLVDGLQQEDTSSPEYVINGQQEKDKFHNVEVECNLAKTKVLSEQIRNSNQPVGDAFVHNESDQNTSVVHNTVIDARVIALELSQVDLPSISNHEIYSSFSSKSSSNKSTTAGEEDSYNEEVKIAVQKQNVHYGSLLKKPESYIYKSRRELDEEINKQKEAVTKAMLANTTMEKTSNLQIGLVSGEHKKRESVDDKSVSALTRTMIGDWMWKYTRKVVGSGISENRHRRFFWIHPYTQTLYWSSKEPGSNNRQSNTKSVLVESFVVLDDDSEPEKSIPPSILIKTPSRGLKIQCMNIIAHQNWIKSLNFLLDDSNKDNSVAPKLSSLGSVSKHHYLQRKMSVQRQQLSNETTSTITTSTKDNTISVLPFKFEPLATVAIDDLMPPPTPTTFTL